MNLQQKCACLVINHLITNNYDYFICEKFEVISVILNIRNA